MQVFSLPWLFVAVICASLIVLAVLWYLSISAHALENENLKRSEEPTNFATFLFENDQLVDADCALMQLPWSDRSGMSEWRYLRSWLGNRFGTLPNQLTSLELGEVREIQATNKTDAASLTLTGLGDIQRVQLNDPTEQSPSGAHHALELQSFVSKLEDVLDEVPCAVRVFDKTHETIWQNEKFSKFPLDQIELLSRTSGDPSRSRRVHIPAQHGLDEKFLSLSHLEKEQFQALYVTDVTQVVQAEKARREFIQTLTKTFASLTAGLLVFDQDQRLALFNPGLIDLTGLRPEFLSERPSVTEVFDHLRNNSMLPEPKNYGSRRNQLKDMIRSASEGLYHEEWSLPNGMTYRVTGRPHPDGAVAFLFEDISAEIALTRKFRSQIDLRQAALDAVDYAVAVIDPNLTVLTCNKSWTELFGVDPDSTFIDMTAPDFLRVCKDKLPDEGFWQLCEQAISDRKTLTQTLTDTENKPYLCKVRQLSGNATNISVMALPVSAEEDAHLHQAIA